jgi:hypothetical protein
VSEQTYGNCPGQLPLAGEYQGKGDVAILYALLSSIVLDAHESMYEGITLPSPSVPRAIKKRNDGYVDDVNTWAASMECDGNATDHTIYLLNKGSQSLTDLNEVGGGSTAFHKSVSQLLAWKSNGRFLEIDYDRVGEVILQDNKGAPSKIAQLRPDKGNAGLGYMMAVDASQRDEFENRKSKIFQICVGAQSSRLSFKEAKQLLEQRLLMQTKYGLHLSQFTEKQCKELTVRINATFLPKLHIHSKMKRAVVWGPRSLGGLGLNTDKCAGMK